MINKMKNILTAPFITDICKLTTNLYRLGWDERNGGNISYIVPQEEVAEYLDLSKTIRNIPMAFECSFLAGKIFVVTGTGKYFKNVIDAPGVNLGVVRVASDAKSVDLLWGYEDGGRPTSELAAHLMTHIVRLKADSAHRVVIHTHTTNVIAMTFVHDLDERAFTRTLWQMCTECLVVFPDGVGVLPWMLCGNDAIGAATAQKMKEFRVVVWAHHGIFGTGKDLDETFGLIETVEKAAEIFIKIMDMPIKQTITDQDFWILANSFGLTPKAGFLE
jgi:rhamnulose-1-phosphate aldolase